jgi:membrane protein EpsK
MTLNLAMVPLFAVHTALNKVKGPALVTLATGLLNIGLSIWWAGWGTYGIGVAFATLVALTMKNAVYTPLYTAHILKVPKMTFIASAVPGVVASGVAMVVCLGLARAIDLATWPALAVAALAVSLVYGLVTWRILVSEDDRVVIRSLIGPRSRS